MKTDRCCAGAAQASEAEHAAARKSADVRLRATSVNAKSRGHRAELIFPPLEFLDRNAAASLSDSGHTPYGGRRYVDPGLQSHGATSHSMTCACLVIRQAGKTAQ